MMGNLRLEPVTSSMSLIHSRWDSRLLALWIPVSGVRFSGHQEPLSTYQTDQLNATGSELGLELGEGTELSGANGGEVIL